MELVLNSGDDIKKLRQQLGLNQIQFWQPLGVTQSGGSRYEAGRKTPKPVALLLKLAYGSSETATSALTALRAVNNGSAVVAAGPLPRAIIHLEVGSKDWQPSSEDFSTVASLFKGASVDPTGGVVVTADGKVKARLSYFAQADGLSLAVASITAKPSKK